VTDGPAYFDVSEIPWPSEEPASAPPELVAEAKRLGARRKFLARGEGGFFSQVSEFPAGYVVPMHTHDHHELIVILAGGCTLLGGGPSLTAGDSMVLVAGYEYGFTADDDGMTFMTIRTGESSTDVSPGGRA
jgi:quercetin dioxygenase-like cupin family protein